MDEVTENASHNYEEKYPLKNFENEYFLRSMIEEDLENVLKLENKLFKSPWTRDFFLGEILNPISKDYVLVRKEDNLVIGYMVFWIVYGEGQLLNIALNELFQGKGLASKMIDFMLEDMDANNVMNTFLEVRESNLKAISLYKNKGFEAIYKRKKYYGKEDALIMARVRTYVEEENDEDNG